MFKRIHDRFGTAGLVLSIVAIVLALTGGAYAAKQAGLNKKQKKQVGKIAKKEAKKFANSNPGAPGVPGPAGPQGPKGDTGAAGAAGTNGSDGTNGTDGKSVEVSGTASGCVEGGATVQVEGEPGTAQEVCNGEAGTFNPSGFTQTGTWSPPMSGNAFGSLLPGVMEAAEAPATEYVLPVSFSIPLESAPEFVFVPTPGTGYGEAAGECPGVTAEGVPTAEPGKFCVYQGSSVGFHALSVSAIKPNGAALGVTPVGTMLWVKCEGEEEEFCHAAGVWAVSG